MIKRLFDLTISILSLLVLAPLLLFLYILVRNRLDSPGIFVQIRPGLLGKPFKLYKFRTMSGIRDKHGQLLPDKERLTKLGIFVRNWSLDELPELWNVFMGDMSIVGPRPLLMEYLERYTPEQARRHELKPGITGWAQVNGRNAITWEEKFRLDVWYVDNRSIWLDIKIIGMTFLKILKREGISHPDEATMHEFMGTKSDG